MARVTFDGPYKTGVLDKDESELIWNTLQEYMNKNQCTDEDLCPGLRAAEPGVMEAAVGIPSGISSRSKPEKKRDVWSDLARMLPERKPKTIYQHGTRLLMKARLTEWTPETKEQLKVLVTKHGQQWAHLGRLLNKNPDDVKHTYKRLTTPRAKKGKFTKEEDSRLQAAMFKILQVNSLRDPIFSSGKKLPDGTWNSVTEEMSRERTPTDYLRRWSAILKIARRNEILPVQQRVIHNALNSSSSISIGTSIGTSIGNKSSSSRESKQCSKKYSIRAFLKRLSEEPRYILDKSDINWTKLEKELGATTLARKWNTLMDKNKHCNDKFFTHQVKILCESHQISTAGMPQHPSSNGPAPHHHHAYPSTHTVTLPHGSVPIQAVNPSIQNHSKVLHDKGLDSNSESESDSSDEEDDDSRKRPLSQTHHESVQEYKKQRENEKAGKDIRYR